MACLLTAPLVAQNHRINNQMLDFVWEFKCPADRHVGGGWILQVEVQWRHLLVQRQLPQQVRARLASFRNKSK